MKENLTKSEKPIKEEDLKPKNIVERHLSEDKTNVKILAALIELEDIIRGLGIRLAATEEALAFFANWYNRTQEPSSQILVPEHLSNINTPKIIL